MGTILLYELHSQGPQRYVIQVLSFGWAGNVNNALRIVNIPLIVQILIFHRQDLGNGASENLQAHATHRRRPLLQKYPHKKSPHPAVAADVRTGGA
jgi:hypothetical protein